MINENLIYECKQYYEKAVGLNQLFWSTIGQTLKSWQANLFQFKNFLTIYQRN